MGCMDGLRQCVDGRIHPDATPFSIGPHHLSGKQGHVLRFQMQVGNQLVVDECHLLSPPCVAGVALALVQEYSLYDTISLRFLRQCQESLVGIVAITFEHPLHPLRCPRSHIVVDRVLHKRLYLTTAYSHRDNAHPDAVGQVGNHRPAKIVDGRQAGILTAERRHGSVPLSHPATELMVVDGCHHSEPRVNPRKVLRLYLGIALHIRLSETEEDIEIGIRRGTGSTVPKHKEQDNE